jgi:hypothetical protein
MFNGKRVYVSDNTHADGSGGTDVNYYVFFTTTGGGTWKISRTSPLVNSTGNVPIWVGSTSGVISDYNPRLAGIPSVGTATTTFGPTDHSEETGSAGFETDGVTGFIDLKTLYDGLNDLRGGKFGIVSIYNDLGGNAMGDALYSSETGQNAALKYSVDTVEGQVNNFWFGTDSYAFIDEPSAIETLHNTIIIVDAVDLTEASMFIDGALLNRDSVVSGLNAALSTRIRLGANSYAESNLVVAEFGDYAIIDLSAIITGDWVAWQLGLSQAINAVTSYDPHDIAAAINAYDSNITGSYYALNELASGDASDYYLLAYDIETQTAITQGVYGLVSPSGVTGTVLVEPPPPVTGEGGYRARYGGEYRSRYNGGGRN